MSTIRLAASSAALSAVLLLAGCGGSSSSGVTTASGHVAALDDLILQKANQCGGGMSAAYVKLLLDVGYDLDPARIAANPHIGYDATAGARCRAAFAAMTCTQFIIPGDCYAALVGTQADGAACTSGAGWDCADGYCDFGSSCNLAGTCVAAPVLGDSCASVSCKPGFNCNNDTQICEREVVVPVVAAGGSCAVDLCPDTQYCNASSVCTDRVADGQPCGGNDQWCARGSSCVSNVCVKDKVLGSACTVGNFDCPQAAFCNASSVCAAVPDLGQPCGVLAGSEQAYCYTGYCDATAGGTGTCRAFKPVGATCTASSSECGFHGDCSAGLVCETNYCTRI